MAYQSGYGSRMANLHMRRGEQAAQDAMGRGQMWAEVANIPLRTMQGMVEAEDLMRRRRREDENREYMRSLRETQEYVLKGREKADRRAGALRTIFEQSPGVRAGTIDFPQAYALANTDQFKGYDLRSDINRAQTEQTSRLANEDLFRSQKDQRLLGQVASEITNWYTGPPEGRMDRLNEKVEEWNATLGAANLPQFGSVAEFMAESEKSGTPVDDLFVAKAKEITDRGRGLSADYQRFDEMYQTIRQQAGDDWRDADVMRSAPDVLLRLAMQHVPGFDPRNPDQEHLDAFKAMFEEEGVLVDYGLKKYMRAGEPVGFFTAKENWLESLRPGATGMTKAQAMDIGERSQYVDAGARLGFEFPRNASWADLSADERVFNMIRREVEAENEGDSGPRTESGFNQGPQTEIFEILSGTGEAPTQDVVFSYNENNVDQETTLTLPAEVDVDDDASARQALSRYLGIRFIGDKVAINEVTPEGNRWRVPDRNNEADINILNTDSYGNAVMDFTLIHPNIRSEMPPGEGANFLGNVLPRGRALANMTPADIIEMVEADPLGAWREFTGDRFQAPGGASDARILNLGGVHQGGAREVEDVLVAHAMGQPLVGVLESLYARWLPSYRTDEERDGRQVGRTFEGVGTVVGEPSVSSTPPPFLAAGLADKSDDQQHPVFEEFFKQLNPDEVLRQFNDGDLAGAIFDALKTDYRSIYEAMTHPDFNELYPELSRTTGGGNSEKFREQFMFGGIPRWKETLEGYQTSDDLKRLFKAIITERRFQ